MTFEQWYGRYNSEEQLLREQFNALVSHFTKKEFCDNCLKTTMQDATIEYPNGRPTIIVRGGFCCGLTDPAEFRRSRQGQAATLPHGQPDQG